MAKNDRPDAALFKDMSTRELDRLARRLADAAARQADRGECDTCLDMHQVTADLNAAWWDKFEGNSL